jgi:hypothetical protein
MAYIWMHMLHVPRGIFGVYLVIFKTPKTYELIESISDFNQSELEEHWGFEKMAQHIRENFKKHLVNLLTENRKFFVGYAILSYVCFLLDLIGLLIQLIRFGSDGDEYSDLFMLAVVIIFLYTVLSYLVWVTTFYFRIEPKYRRDAMKAGLGYANGLKDRVTSSFHDYRTKLFVKNEAPRRPEERVNRGPFQHNNQD